MGNSPGSPDKRRGWDNDRFAEVGPAANSPPLPQQKLRRSQSAPVEVRRAPPSPGHLNRMARFAGSLDDAFSLIEGLYNQLDTNGSSASMTRGELDQLADAMRSLCNMEAHRLQHDTENLPLESDISTQFIGEEYALSSAAHRSIRAAILRDLKETPVEVSGRSLKSRRQSCVYLTQNFKPIVEQYLEKINDWSFDVLGLRELQVSENPLVVITMAAMASQGLTEGYIPNESLLVEYLKRVEASYFENPYHNSWHAADVVQATNYGIITSAKNITFPRLAKFSAIIAAAVHDYSDRSPLEMMHANKAFSLMLKPNCNILGAFKSSDDRVAIRKIIISMVLSTDNANHSTLIENFTRMRVSDTMNLNENTSDQQTLLNMILHSMDVSNVARPWAISRKWLELITMEFYAQGDSERSAGIPVTPIMDRQSTTPMSQLQTGFISFVVKPLFIELNNAGLDVMEPLTCIEENLTSWASVTAGKSVVSTEDAHHGYTAPSFLKELTSTPRPELSSLRAAMSSAIGAAQKTSATSSPRNSVTKTLHAMSSAGGSFSASLDNIVEEDTGVV